MPILLHQAIQRQLSLGDFAVQGVQQKVYFSGKHCGLNCDSISLPAWHSDTSKQDHTKKQRTGSGQDLFQCILPLKGKLCH